MDREARLRIAAAGDIHCSMERRQPVAQAFGEIAGKADLVLVAGDLTTVGRPEEAESFAWAARHADAPVFAVLGNHDLHSDCGTEVAAALTEGGVTLLDRSHSVCRTAACEVGIVGTKGFVGGFTGSHLPDFGEALLREVYAETTREIEALERGLHTIAPCPVRIVLLHYAPVAETLEGEPPGIWAFLGSDRLAGPIATHEPDMVLHGHAHSGRFEARIGNVPVYNVSVPVMRKDFWIFEVDVPAPAHSAIH